MNTSENPNIVFSNIEEFIYTNDGANEALSCGGSIAYETYITLGHIARLQESVVIETTD